MAIYRRPWWLVANKSDGLVTTIREESGPDERIFIIRGEPFVQGLAWLTWGPAVALLTVVLLVILAISLEIKEQAGPVRVLFIAAFLALPALVWIGTAMVLARISAKYLQAERQAEGQECIIHLNHEQGYFSYQLTAQPTPGLVAYHDIHQVRTTHAIGKRGAKAWRLVIDTNRGTIVLLDEALGNSTQKVDLAREIQAALKQGLTPPVQP